MFCTRCGTANTDDAMFCVSCNAALTRRTTPQEDAAIFQDAMTQSRNRNTNSPASPIRRARLICPIPDTRAPIRCRRGQQALQADAQSHP